MSESTLSYIRQNAVIAHSASHENGGGDEVNVAALSGELADPQPPKTHAADHQNGGGDEINVADLSGELADRQKVKLNYVDGSHLSATFGASAERLRNILVAPIAGEIVRMLGCGTSPFDGLINGGPTATSVVYDGETNETMFTGLASGATRWGRIVLHNTTRGTSRKIVSVNLGTNTIATESSVDSWADNDVITCQSQTNAQAGFFDIDISSEIPATTDGIFLFVVLDDTEGNQDDNRYVMFHPYETYDDGKRQWINGNLANIKGQGVYPIKVIDQKFTCCLGWGCVTVNLIMAVKGAFEFADT